MHWKIWLLALGLVAAASSASALELGHYPCCNHPAYATAATDAVNAALAPHGARLGLVGDFVGIAFPSDGLDALPASLESTWVRGAVPVVNITDWMPLEPFARPVTAADWAIANRMYVLAWQINAWVAAGAGRHLYLVPWPEMNGAWTPYGLRPDLYIEAVGRLRWVLAQTGALQYTSIVFAPNVGDPADIARYYPGAWVDVVGGSAYSVAGCGGATLSPEQAVGPLLSAMRALAPDKPILLAQTGHGGGTVETKAAWAARLIGWLRTQPDVVGFVWFDRPGGDCDFTLSPSGWASAVSQAPWWWVPWWWSWSWVFDLTRWPS